MTTPNMAKSIRSFIGLMVFTSALILLVHAAANRNFNANANLDVAALVKMIQDAPTQDSSYEGFTRGLMNEVYYKHAQNRR